LTQARRVQHHEPRGRRFELDPDSLLGGDPAQRADAFSGDRGRFQRLRVEADVARLYLGEVKGLVDQGQQMVGA